MHIHLTGSASEKVDIATKHSGDTGVHAMLHTKHGQWCIRTRVKTRVNSQLISLREFHKVESGTFSDVFHIVSDIPQNSPQNERGRGGTGWRGGRGGRGGGRVWRGGGSGGGRGGGRPPFGHGHGHGARPQPQHRLPPLHGFGQREPPPQHHPRQMGGGHFQPQQYPPTGQQYGMPHGQQYHIAPPQYGDVEYYVLDDGMPVWMKQRPAGPQQGQMVAQQASVGWTCGVPPAQGQAQPMQGV